MRVKRNSRKKTVVGENTENIGDQHETEAQNLQQSLEIQHTLGMANKPTANLMNQKEKENQVAVHTKATEKEKTPTQQTFNNLSSSDATMDGNTEEIVAMLLQEPNVLGDNSLQYQSSKGQKRLFQHTLDLLENENLLGSSTLVSYTDFMNLKKQHVDLESRVKRLEAQSMPRPQHPEVINYFNDMTNKSRDVPEHNNDGENDPTEKIIKLLGVDKKKLIKSHKKTATATARSLLKLKYPNPSPSLTLTNVDKSIVNSIKEYTKYSNPHDLSSEGELRKAMSNYFASFKSRNKTKKTTVLNRVDEELMVDNIHTMTN